MKKYFISFILIGFCLLLLCMQSFSIPAFSRKYKTSCVTCHSVYPQLNPFGEAFRINGYQFPQEDEEKTKEEQVPLGSESYKKVWPNAVWPNFMPGSAPFALRGRSGFVMTTVDSVTTAEFGQPAVQLLGAGAIGKDVTMFVGAHLFEAGTTGSLDRLYLKLDNLFTSLLPEKALYFQVGQFIPELVPFATNHRGITEAAYAFNTYDPTSEGAFAASHGHGAAATTGGHGAMGSTAFGIEQFQLGVEFSGIIKSRLRYVAGVVNGSGTMVDINSDKDFYGRLAYKFGGLGFDGSSKDSINNKGETSFTFSAFGYKGIGTDTANMNYNFSRTGFDVNFYFRNLNFVGGYIMGAGGVNNNQDYNLFFGEINCAVFPWLMGVLRYEQANPHGEEPLMRVIPHISALIVPNVKIKIETRLNPDHLDFDNFYLGLDFAF